jgi:hypothetical protein
MTRETVELDTPASFATLLIDMSAQIWITAPALSMEFPQISAPPHAASKLPHNLIRINRRRLLHLYAS